MQALRDETTHVLRFSLCSESESSSLIWESPQKTLPGVITSYVFGKELKHVYIYQPK